MTKAKTTVQLSRAVECDGRTVDHVVIACAPGEERFPVNERDGNFEVDALEVLAVIVRRTGLSKPALEKLSNVDLLALALTLFLPRLQSVDGNRKSKR